MKTSSLSPLMGVLKPLAKKYVNSENIDSLFHSLTADCQLQDNERPVILIHRPANQSVMAGVYAVDDAHHITRCYSTMPVEQLIDTLLTNAQ